MAMSATETSPTLSIPAGSTATTVVPSVLDNGGSKANHVAYVIISGTLTAGVVTLETSLDNVNWASVPAQGASNVPSGAIFGSVATPAGFATGTGNYVLSLQNSPAQYVRAAITTTITGGSVTAWVASA